MDDEEILIFLLAFGFGILVSLFVLKLVGLI